MAAVLALVRYTGFLYVRQRAHVTALGGLLGRSLRRLRRALIGSRIVRSILPAECMASDEYTDLC